MRQIRRYRVGEMVYTVPLVVKLTGLHPESARVRLVQFEQGKISEAHLLRPAQVTKPKKRQL